MHTKHKAAEKKRNKSVESMAGTGLITYSASQTEKSEF